MLASSWSPNAPSPEPRTTPTLGAVAKVFLTAAAAWYTSAAGVSNGLNGKLRIPVGRPLI